MKRYSIMGTQYGFDREVELAQCDSNPNEVAKGFEEMTLKVSHSILPGGKKTKVRKYSWVRIVENV